jgi:hypothetical protein
LPIDEINKKMLAKLRRNKDIKAMGLKIRIYGDCQMGEVIKITKETRTEFFGFRENYDELLEIVLKVFNS